METKDLSRAYRELLAAAEAVTKNGQLAEADRTLADWILAHIALSDRGLAGTARQVLAAKKARIDNTAAMSKTEISKMVSATTHAERIDMVRRNAQELIDLIDRTPDSAANAGVSTHLVDRSGTVVFDSDLPWGDIVKLRAVEHIPGHAATMASFCRPRAEGRDAPPAQDTSGRG